MSTDDGVRLLEEARDGCEMERAGRGAGVGVEERDQMG